MKKETIYKRYKNQKPVGGTYISDTLGLRVYKPDANDKYDCDYICSWRSGEKEWGFHKHIVHYSTDGRAFIRKGFLRIYLDEVWMKY
jgi:hypothetical protein